MNDEAVSLLRQILERVERIESHLGIASAPPLEPTPVQEQINRDVARLGGRIGARGSERFGDKSLEKIAYVWR